MSQAHGGPCVAETAFVVESYMTFGIIATFFSSMYVYVYVYVCVACGCCSLWILFSSDCVAVSVGMLRMSTSCRVN
jgi:hypothetical protein